MAIAADGGERGEEHRVPAGCIAQHEHAHPPSARHERQDVVHRCRVIRRRVGEGVGERPCAEAGAQPVGGAVILRGQIQRRIPGARDARRGAQARVHDIVQLVESGERLCERDEARELARAIGHARLEQPVGALELPDQRAVLAPEPGGLEARPHDPHQLGRGNRLGQVAVDLPYSRDGVFEVRIARDQEDC